MTTDTIDTDTSPLLATLEPEAWGRANEELLAKLLTEWTFEEILAPEALSPTGFRLALPENPRCLDGKTGALHFEAKRRHLGHWRVDPASLRYVDESGRGDDRPPEVPDVIDVVARLAPSLGLTPTNAAGLIGELSSTLLSDVRQLSRGRPVDDLAEVNPLILDGEMRAHPWLVANKGRVGFDADDLARYAPEAQQPVQLLWLAASPAIADSQTISGLDHATAVREQVGETVWKNLKGRVWDTAPGLDPDEAVYFPVHPWQWRHKILPSYAGQLAEGRLVPLGTQPARYLPQQSLRTMVDIDHPERRYLKLPLSILNTSVYRGLVRDRTLAAPALSQWIIERASQDPFLKETGLVLLGEVASVSVAHPAYETLPDSPYQHTEMLGAIWRESVEGHLARDERAITLAALLHRDPAGIPFLDPVIERSGMAVNEWVDGLHNAVLPPLVHLLYRFGMMFSPHAQNCLLVTAGHRPVRLAFKDFADDAVIASTVLPEIGELPPEVRAALGSGEPPDTLPEWLQGGLLLCVYRYLSELLEDHFGYAEADFWASAAGTLDSYHERFADELSERFELFNLRRPTFPKLCVNRLRLFERGYSDDPERPHISTFGSVVNPLV